MWSQTGPGRAPRRGGRSKGRGRLQLDDRFTGLRLGEGLCRGEGLRHGDGPGERRSLLGRVGLVSAPRPPDSRPLVLPSAEGLCLWLK